MNKKKWMLPVGILGALVVATGSGAGENPPENLRPAPVYAFDLNFPSFGQFNRFGKAYRFDLPSLESQAISNLVEVPGLYLLPEEGFSKLEFSQYEPLSQEQSYLLDESDKAAYPPNTEPVASILIGTKYFDGTRLYDFSTKSPELQQPDTVQYQLYDPTTSEYVTVNPARDIKAIYIANELIPNPEDAFSAINGQSTKFQEYNDLINSSFEFSNAIPAKYQYLRRQIAESSYNLLPLTFKEDEYAAKSIDLYSNTISELQKIAEESEENYPAVLAGIRWAVLSSQEALPEDITSGSAASVRPYDWIMLGLTGLQAGFAGYQLAKDSRKDKKNTAEEPTKISKPKEEFTSPKINQNLKISEQEIKAFYESLTHLYNDFCKMVAAMADLHKNIVEIENEYHGKICSSLRILKKHNLGVLPTSPDIFIKLWNEFSCGKKIENLATNG